MKRNKGVLLLLVSIVITIIASVLKIMHQALAEFLLWAGMLTFITAIGMIIYQLLKPVHPKARV